MPLDEHATANLANWESRVGIHARSRTYDLEAFASDPEHLSGVVDFDRERLGDLTGLDAVHLQCHIGTDTVSLARLGARVTGVDFSPAALEVARGLAASASVDARFVQSDVYEAPGTLGGEQFDLVYTGVGALNWLPDVRRWARVVVDLLRPGGRLHLYEGHPMLGTLDDERDDELLVVRFPYFETKEPTRWESTETYTDGDAVVDSPVTYEWAHGLGEVVQAVLDAGLEVTGLEEHRTLEWPFFSWMEPAGGGRYRLPTGPELLPLMYTLRARRPG
jgi:SAM-dependent methyltransferase